MANEKKKFYDVFIELIHRIDMSKLHSPEIANIVGTILIFLYIILTAITPLLYQIQSLLITFGKIFFNRDVSANNTNATNNDVFHNLLILVGEVLICVLFCLVSDIINGNREAKKLPSDTENEGKDKDNNQ